MISYNKTISDCFLQSLKNAYGSKRNFEKELIYRAYQLGNKGKLYFGMNRFLNFSVSQMPDFKTEYNLLICNLDSCDIFNFIEDIDYTKLSVAYTEIRKLIES